MTIRTPPVQPTQPLAFLDGTGVVASRLRAANWSGTSIGQPGDWPQPLRTAIRLMLAAAAPACVLWGPDLLLFYNDAYLAKRDSGDRCLAFARPACEIWSETWTRVEPQIAQVLAGGASVCNSDVPFEVIRDGRREIVFWTHNYLPIDDPAAPSGVGGVFVLCDETTEQVRRRQAEAEHNALLQVIEHSNDFIAIADLDGRIVYMNTGGKRMLGLTDDFDTGTLKFTDYLAPASYDIFHKVALPVARERGLWVGEMQIVNLQTGLAFDVRRSTFALKDEAGNIVRYATITRDISHEKAAEASLSESERLFRVTFERAAVGVAHMATNGHWLRVNQAVCDILGYTEAELIGGDFRTLTYPEDLEPNIRLARQLLADEAQSYRIEKRYIRKDGSVIWAMLTSSLVRGPDGEPQHFVSVIEDISDRKAAEAALLESEQRWRTLAAALPQLVWTCTADGRTDYVSDRWVAFTGRDLDTVLRDGVYDLIHPDDIGQMIAAWQRSVNGAEIFDWDGRMRRHDGAWRWFKHRAFAVRWPEGAIQRWFGTSTDITEIVEAREVIARDRAELERLVAARTEQLQRTQEQLAQSEKLTALGQLAGGIAHDFNNIVQAVQGGAALIRRRSDDARAVGHLARLIEEAADRGASITRRLLSFARRDELKSEVLSPLSVLADITEVLQHTMGSGINVRLTTVGAEGLRIQADKGQLQTVLINLATNARDAMPGGGTLTLCLDENVIETVCLRAMSLPPGRYVRITVADTGEGMPPDVLARAAEPFFTTKPTGQGTGLGLSMARGFAEQSKGALHIESKPGTGTTITMWLPQATEDLAQRLRGEGLLGLDRPIRLLLVDDEPLVREVLAEGLRERGFLPMQAKDGATALAIIEAGAEFDAMLTDYSMPHMDGVALISEVRRRRPGLPAILLTGNAGSDLEAKLTEDTVDRPNFRLMRKPIDADRLASQIVALIDGDAQKTLDQREKNVS
jgi:PAS domain S-box-containing protein